MICSEIFVFTSIFILPESYGILLRSQRSEERGRFTYLCCSVLQLIYTSASNLQRRYSVIGVSSRRHCHLKHTRIHCCYTQRPVMSVEVINRKLHRCKCCFETNLMGTRKPCVIYYFLKCFNSYVFRSMIRSIYSVAMLESRPITIAVVCFTVMCS